MSSFFQWLVSVLLLSQPFEDPDATFIRSVSYRSPDGHRLDNIVKQINDLKKEANKREQQKKEMADVIEQGSLVELKGRRPVKLPEVFIRPALDGKRLPGEVEIHQNGIRYQSLGSQKVGQCWCFLIFLLNSDGCEAIDVLFSNIKHLFFQSCDHELVVIVHLHLRAPIMIGKKKTFVCESFFNAKGIIIIFIIFRIFNSFEKHQMSSSMKPVIERENIGMEMKMKLKWSNKKENAEQCSIKNSRHLLKKLQRLLLLQLVLQLTDKLKTKRSMPCRMAKL